MPGTVIANQPGVFFVDDQVRWIRRRLTLRGLGLGTLALVYPATTILAVNGLVLSAFTVGLVVTGRARSLRTL